MFASVRILSTVALIACSVGPTFAADWSQFRGPNSKGVADEHEYAITWSTTENISWRISLPRPGASSPITSADRVFVICYRGVDRQTTDPSRFTNETGAVQLE